MIVLAAFAIGVAYAVVIMLLGCVARRVKVRR